MWDKITNILIIILCIFGGIIGVALFIPALICMIVIMPFCLLLGLLADDLAEELK